MKDQQGCRSVPSPSLKPEVSSVDYAVTNESRQKLPDETELCSNGLFNNDDQLIFFTK